MKKKNEIRDNLFIQMPQPFRRQQLSLSSQKKDKQIRLKLQQLHQRRHQHKQFQQLWQIQKENFNQFLKEQVATDATLKTKYQEIRRDLFKLQIRREQIESKTNPHIVQSKMKTLRQYLKCVPYTLSNYYEKVIQWGGEEQFLKYKFLFNYCMDKVLQRTQAQRWIKRNIESIVHCCKVKFEGEWLMMTLKKITQDTPLQCLSNTQKAFTYSAADMYELSVYAITGKYFCFKKTYTFQQLQGWTAQSLQRKEQQRKKQIQHKNLEQSRRISMAETLANNVLHQLVSLVNEGSTKSEKESDNQSGKIEVETLLLANKRLENKTIQQENESEVNFKRQFGTNMSADNSVEVINNPFISFNEENSDSTLQKEEESSSNESDQAEKITQKQPFSSKRNVRSKSFFYSETKYSEKRFKNLNKSFMKGNEKCLFPANNPLQNIVILKHRNQVYFLQHYLQLKDKHKIVNKAFQKLLSKTKMKKFLNKCLFYKKMRVSDFYDTRMGYKREFSLLVLFMLKKDDFAKELKLTCTALQFNQNIKGQLRFEHSLYKQRAVQKAQSKQSRRTSNNKIIKNSIGRRSKDMKRRTASRNFLKGSIEYQKSSFHFSKKESDNSPQYTANIKQIFDEFIKDHIIWAEEKRFMSLQYFKKLQRNVVLIQRNYVKHFLKSKYRAQKKQGDYKCKYFVGFKVLASARVCQNYEQVRVWLQNVSSSCTKVPAYRFALKYKTRIFEFISNFQFKGSIEQQNTQLYLGLKKTAQLQDMQQELQLKQRPARLRTAFINFFRAILLKKKTKNNTFFIKKLIVKQRLFLLIIRRDPRIKSLLQCNLYDFQGVASKPSNTRDTNSEIGYKQTAAQSNNQLNLKPCHYQRIFLREQYFEEIPKKAIIDEFLIDYKVFLLKPAKQPSIYYIERLCPFDINYDEVNKELASLQKQVRHSTKITHVNGLTNKSIIGRSNASIFKKENDKLLPMEKEAKGRNTSHNDLRKLNKKTSLLQMNKDLLNFRKQNYREYPQNTNMSLADSKNKQSYKIHGNSHHSIIYFSLYKAKDIFFYLDLYIVTKKRYKKEFQRSAQQESSVGSQRQSQGWADYQNNYHYSQELEKVSSERLYKKQLQDLGNLLITKKIANWLHQNEQRVVQISEGKDKNEETQNRIQLEEGLNMVGKCLQFFDNTSKRFSQNIIVNLRGFDKERSSRTNTLNL